MRHALGIGKTIFNSGVCSIPFEDYHQLELVLSERLNRAKNSGAWPEQALRAFMPIEVESAVQNRDVQTVKEFEDYLNSRFPFVDSLKAKGLEQFLDENCITLNHHLAHAYSASVFSPFEESLILVIDGAGSLHPEGYEFLTLYHFKNQNFHQLDKKFTRFNDKGYSESIGLFYEAISEFIFNSKTLAGKVMGLAPLGKSMGVVDSYVSFLESLDWSKRFNGKSKEEWENSPNLNLYQDLAATAQENFEHYLFSYLQDIAKQYPNSNLIMVGGCALNCTFNGKLWKTKFFKNIYVPPNPGDEGISLGCAWSSLKDKVEWRPLPKEKQTSSRGKKREYSFDEVKKVFGKYQISHYDLNSVADLLISQEVVAWFIGRSEIGPRALGHRSILALPIRGIKNYLNEKIKFRESFRPYGCTIPQDNVSDFFDVEKDFENPFMSFAIPIKNEYRHQLEDIGHVDHTSRFQTLHREQNPQYYDLLKKVGEKCGTPILLNTSLNVMGEPILETIEDALRFFENSKVNYLVFNEYLIEKKS
ncbi:MAG: carbamoyltransferase C-terminal domain-containing protein [Candidatus Caldatribacteriota bacterium]